MFVVWMDVAMNYDPSQSRYAAVWSVAKSRSGEDRTGEAQDVWQPILKQLLKLLKIPKSLLFA